MLFSMAVQVMPQSVRADSLPQLVISQTKITSSNGQFITLYNQTADTLDLSQFEIYYINSANKLSNLPIAGMLAPHGFYMLSDDQVRLCYQMTINSVSLGLATSIGTLQIWHLSADKSTKTLQDNVSWTKSDQYSRLRQPTDLYGDPQVLSPGSGSWIDVQPDPNNSCVLQAVVGGANVTTPSANPSNQLLPGELPPAVFVNASDDSTSSSTTALPAGDIGLAAPQISELLPNPAEPQTDSEDEFIELYNSNNTSFDLSGFKIEVGSSTKHDYIFPDGTTIPAKSFKAFFSEDTGLSLSNSGGQAWLLDPAGNVISQADPYGTAKDGQTWALGPDGKWYWTMTATPNTPNIVLIPATASTKTSTTASKTSTPKTSTKAVKAASTTAKKTSTSGASSDPQTTGGSKMHLWILAVIGAGAVLYAVYEYRNDLANLLYRARRYRETRRASGQSS